MAVVNGASENNPTLRYRHRETGMRVWAGCLILATCFILSAECAYAAETDAQHRVERDVAYSEDSAVVTTPFLPAGSVHPVQCRCSSLPTSTEQPLTQQGTRDEGFEFPTGHQGFQSKSNRLRIEKNRGHKRRRLQHSAVDESNRSHQVPATYDTYEAAASVEDDPRKMLCKCHGSTTENISTAATPVEKTQNASSNVRVQHARSKRDTAGRVISEAVRRMQHPISTFRGDVMQQTIGQGAGVSSLHQRAAILQRQNVAHARTLPLLSVLREPSPETAYPAGAGRLDMYRNNQFDWLSGLPNIGIY